MRFGRFSRLGLALLVGSVLVYALTWFFSGMGESDPSAAADALLWLSAIGLVGAILVLVWSVLRRAS